MRNRDFIGAYEAKTRFSEILERVERGAEITLTRHGTPVARMVPLQKQPSQSERAQVIEAMIESRRGCTLGGLKVRDLIAEGRK